MTSSTQRRTVEAEIALTTTDVGQARVVAQHHQHHQRLPGRAGFAPARTAAGGARRINSATMPQGLPRQ